MGFLTGKRVMLIGLLLVLLIGIPLTLYLTQKQQETHSNAAASTTLYFAAPGTLTPVGATQKSIGDTVSFDLVINPGQNLVSFVKMQITYDPTKFSVESSGSATALAPNTAVLPSTLEGPTYTSGNIAATFSVGADITRVIQTTTKVATITLKAIALTAGTPTQISFSDQTQVLSVAQADQPSENVLSSKSPASVVIVDAAGATPTTAVTAAPTPTTAATAPTPTTAPVGGTTNQPPVCSSLTTDSTPSGSVPFSTNFTVAGTDADGTISKVTFNFGDGPIQDVTQSGGVGTNTVSVQTAHTYNTPGTFTASGIVTDNAGGISSSCTTTVTVGGSIGGPAATTVPEVPTAVPTLPATGPGDTMVRIGIIGAILSIVGSLVFLAL